MRHKVLRHFDFFRSAQRGGIGKAYGDEVSSEPVRGCAQSPPPVNLNLVDAAACRIPTMGRDVEIGSRVSGRTVQTDTGFAADNTAGGLLDVIVSAAFDRRRE